MPCMIDGKDIIEHASMGKCPMFHYPDDLKCDDIVSEPRQTPQPVSLDQWPMWAIRIVQIGKHLDDGGSLITIPILLFFSGVVGDAILALPGLMGHGDVGVGDTIHRHLGKPGEVFKATLSAIGVPCGCSERQAEFNALYPYGELADLG